MLAADLPRPGALGPNLPVGNHPVRRERLRLRPRRHGVSNPRHQILMVAANSTRYSTSVRTFCMVAVLLSAGIVFADPVDDLVNREMAKHRIPGLALEVARPGTGSRTAAYG